MTKLLLIFLMLAAPFSLIAQQTAKNDIILKVNGEELSGKVIKINDDNIEFTYAGESLVYTIKKIDILKITYASGRLEFFNKQILPSENKGQVAESQKSPNGPGLEEHHNKVAILPFAFIRDGQATDDAISDLVQNEAFAYMNKHAGMFSILNPRTTNALLIKAGITKETIKGYTMDDICNILGVEYVIEGMVNMNKTSQTNYQSNRGTTTTKNNEGDRKRITNNSSYATATQNFQTKLTMNIYNDKGNTVYAQERTSFWNTQDGYKLTLEYLLKRSPFYNK